MLEDKISLKNLKIDFQKLSALGFVKEDDYYVSQTQIMDNQFYLIIKIGANNVVCSDVIECETNEKYYLYYVSTSTGKFIGSIREEYGKIIENVKNTCCSKNIFKSKYAQFIIEYVRQKYGDELEYLWAKFPNNAIWRNKVNKKWYGALLIVEKSKIGIKDTGQVEIIDLLMEQEKIEKSVDNKQIFAGYHMNKKHWIAVKLDGSVDINRIHDLIDSSYKLSLNK